MPIAAWGTAPALAAGNAVLLKPAETTPLTALRLAELALEAGLPEHLFQVLPGHGRGRRAAPSSTTPASRRSSSPGPPRVGKQVMAQVRRPGQARSPSNSAARAPTSSSPTPTWRRPRRPRLSPSSTTPARTAAPAPASSSSGRCTTRFLDLLAPALAAVVVGDPADERTQMGPLISPPQLDRVRSLRPRRRPRPCAAARPRAPASGSRRPSSPATRPTRPPPARRSSAPSPSCCPSRTRRTRSGSPTPPPTASPARSGPATSAAPCASRGPSRAGNLSVNSHSSVRYWTPFGGYKQSGVGRELGPDALTAFTETKNVFISTEGPAQ